MIIISCSNPAIDFLHHKDDRLEEHGVRWRARLDILATVNSNNLWAFFCASENIN